MDQRHQFHRESVPTTIAPRVRGIASVVLAVTSVALFVAVLSVNLQSPRVTLLLLVAFAAAIACLLFLLTGFSRQLHRDQRETASALETTEQEFRQMAGNIQEVFWTMDASTRRILFINPAYEAITGRSCRSLVEKPLSYEEIIHPDDRVRVVGKLEEAARSGRFDERFRIMGATGEVRWVWVRGFPGRIVEGKITRLVGTGRDVTALKEAEDQVAANLAKANSAWSEAEALRTATLALTEDLHMDCVLDALLRSLGELVPYTCARVLVPEGGPHWLALGEKLCPEPATKPVRSPLTFVADESPFFQNVWAQRKSVLIRDTNRQQEWQTFAGHQQFRSWLGVPLIASEEFLGFLSIGHDEPGQFTREHLRRSELLAIPAAVAIQNARLYSRAEIYASELEKRLSDLRKAELALDQSELSRSASEEKFEKVFHSSPIAFCITTFKEGRFLEMNAAFERRYGYCREELLGHTVHELRIWEDPSDRRFLLAQLDQGGPVRNVITRFRTKSGEIKLTAYSAERIQFEGQMCILAVSEDVPGSELCPAN
jgi:PAS domain S-box-containing protein